MSAQGMTAQSDAKVPAAVDTVGNLPATVVTPASEQERTQVVELAERVQEVTELLNSGSTELA